LVENLKAIESKLAQKQKVPSFNNWKFANALVDLLEKQDQKFIKEHPSIIEGII